MKENPRVSKSFASALNVISVYKRLIEDKEFVVLKQLLRCGISIGANVNEVQAAQTKKDFASKMAGASKEARETTYWLKLLTESKLTSIDLADGFRDAEERARILTAIVKTSQSSNSPVSLS
jgi:four helix bundle protein